MSKIEGTYKHMCTIGEQFTVAKIKKKHKSNRFKKFPLKDLAVANILRIDQAKVLSKVRVRAMRVKNRVKTALLLKIVRV